MLMDIEPTNKVDGETPSARKAARRALQPMSALPIPDMELSSDEEVLAYALGVGPEAWEQIGPQARRIIGEILPIFVSKFVKANLHYGPDNANVLGPAGQFADIWRKIGPLRRSLWEGQELTREQPDQICMDLIGHLFLTIDMLEQGVNRRGGGPLS